MTAQIVSIRSEPDDPDMIRLAFHASLASLVAAYQTLVELGDSGAVFKAAAEVLLDHRERLAAGDLSVANLVCAIGADLAASAADMEIDLAGDDPDPGETDEAEIAA